MDALGDVGVPANLCLVAAVLFAFYGSADLGRARETIEVVTSEGETVARTVPKSEFRKQVALFYFEADDSTLDTLRKSVPLALEADLQQDLFLTVETPISKLSHAIRRSSFTDGLDMPLALQRELALDVGTAYFVNGSLEHAEDGWVLVTRTYRTREADLVAEQTFRGPRLLQLVDDASRQLRYDLDVPAAHVEETTDLPVAELMTISTPALEAYTVGVDALELQHDFAAAAEALNRAVRIDPTFALAYAVQSMSYMYQGKEEAVMETIRHAQQHDYRLTERMRFVLRANQLFRERRAAEALQVVKQWTTLYPHDVRGWDALAQVQRLLRYDVDATVAAYREILRIDPEQTTYHLSAASMLSEAGRYPEAETAYAAYAEAHPEQPRGHLGRARLLYAQNRPNEARAALDVALRAWGNADASTPLVVEARRFQSTLNGTS